MKSKDKIKTAAQVLLLPQDSILPNPDQPRKRFDYDELEGLAQSIRQNGILQPVTVRRRTDGKNVKFELVAGERRLRAARLVGLTKIPAIETDADEKSSAVLSLIENLQRQDLNFFEEAEAVQRLVEKYSMSREEAADKLGRAQSTLSNKLRLCGSRGNAVHNRKSRAYRTSREGTAYSRKRRSAREGARNYHRPTLKCSGERAPYRANAQSQEKEKSH